jgi:glutaminase
MLGTPQCPANIQKVIDNLIAEMRTHPANGQVADYIPALKNVDPDSVGIACCTLDGEVITAGDADKDFSVQSIAKIYSLVMAMTRSDDQLWERVRMEPSGQAFNSIVQLESENGIPRNPMINAGAIVISDIIVSRYSTPNHAFVQFVSRLCGRDPVLVDNTVFASEKKHGHRNAAMAHLMKDFGNIHGKVENVLEHYFYQCSLSLNCSDLARSLLFLANKGIQPTTGETAGEEVCTRVDCHRVNAILSTSGMYDQSGEFAFSVGLPAKSGVGGGIVAIVPNFGVIAVYSPRLNQFGNSHAGKWLITEFAQKLGLSVF